jgi:Domain of unknown function (DUF4328)
MNDVLRIAAPPSGSSGERMTTLRLVSDDLPQLPPPTVAPPPPPPLPPPPPPMAPVARRAEPLAGRATAATIGIAVSIAASLISIGAALARRRELVRVRNGEFVSDQRLEQVDDWVHGAAVIALLGLVAGAACFIPWFHRAYKNLHARHSTRFGTGWAIGAWFVPFLNLVRPYQIAKELVSLSGRAPTTSTNTVTVWWALLIASGIGNRVVFTFNPETIDEFIRFDTVSPIVDAIWIAAGIFLIVVVRKVTKAQQETSLQGV